MLKNMTKHKKLQKKLSKENTNNFKLFHYECIENKNMLKIFCCFESKWLRAQEGFCLKISFFYKL